MAAPAEALARFDDGAPVGLDELTGRWRGSGLPTGSRLDGLLEAHGWYGKEVADPETVHPLLFRDRAGRPFPVDPALAPIGLLLRHPGLVRTPAARGAFAVAAPLRRTSRPAARARLVEHRGVLSAALVYDALPIVDVLRRIGEHMLLGLMDLRGLAEPFFFLLERDEPAAQSSR
jgi:hypothetical protein